jgi:two-component system chemotaxis sensor kinase CheA
VLYGAPVYRLRGQLLPLVYLNRELKLLLPGAETSSSAVQIVVLQADGRQFGMVVDEINDTEEIVVKPLGKQLKGISCFAGATIMGDGRVALILDVLGLAQEAKVISETRDRTLTDKAGEQTRADERQTLLLFDAGENSRLAIPLSTVARLEEFPLKSIERAGGQEVVQYRGQILPLIQVSQFLPLAAPETTRPDPVQVVVYSESGRSVGLMVSRINDIVQEILTVRREAPRRGISGSAVIQDKVTDLLDVPGIIRAADPDFYRDRKEPS